MQKLFRHSSVANQSAIFGDDASLYDSACLLADAIALAPVRARDLN